MRREKSLESLKEACRGSLAKVECDEGKEYLPYWMHCLDTAGVMKKIYEEKIPRHIKKQLIKNFQNENRIARYFEVLGAAHDFGKLTSYFQSNILRNLPEYEHYTKEIHSLRHYPSLSIRWHNFASMQIMEYLGFSESISSIIGAHHGITQSPYNRNEIEFGDRPHRCHYYGSRGEVEEWKAIWREVGEWILRFFEIDNEEIKIECAQPINFLVCGYLILADWIASNEKVFPLISYFSEEEPNLYPERVEKGWKRIEFTRPVRKDFFQMSSEHFNSCFGFPPNQVQKAFMEIVNNVKSPGIFIVESETGSGKTEAALAGCETLIAKTGCEGVYFGLPTKASANAIFDRFKSWAGKVDGRRHSFSLVYHYAAFNQKFKNLQEGHFHMEKNREESLVVNEWMQGQKQALLAEFALGTVDHILEGGLNSPHVMLTHVALAGKVVVIDEVHAYDPYMNIFLDRMLEWLGAYHTPVILLSATLPNQRREQLIQAYLSGRGEGSKDIEDKGRSICPSLTWTEGNRVFRRNTNFARTVRDIKIKKIQTTKAEKKRAVLKELKNKIRHGGCAAVILNKVKETQEVYRYIRDQLEDCEVVLIHAGFTEKRREELENRIIRKVGKVSTKEERNRLVVVGTQVLEQSLDLDFDYMISDLAPIEALIQRMGRLHRHVRPYRNVEFQKPELTILVTDDETYQGVYSDAKWNIYQTNKLLNGRIVIPNDVPAFLEKVYQPNTSLLEEEDSMGWKLYQNWQGTIREYQNKAKAWTLRSPQSTDHSINGLMDLSLARRKSVVRDGLKRLRVILVRRVEDGLFTGVDEAMNWTLSGLNEVNNENVNWLLGQTVNLPSEILSSKENLEELSEMSEKFSKWRRFPSLKYQFIVELDENLILQLGKQKIAYSSETGIEVLPEKETEYGQFKSSR